MRAAPAGRRGQRHRPALASRGGTVRSTPAGIDREAPALTTGCRSRVPNCVAQRELQVIERQLAKLRQQPDRSPPRGEGWARPEGDGGERAVIGVWG